ncbi:MAG: heme-binding protein [Betaproteobacteria bacterium]|jgi:uncharacterized protein GlcG (DUF336 family)|nr:heme-binding protein [Polynucleobacter sp.]NBY64429.1 heme-binding protein [Betaproteobacteria bacterium]
MFKKLCNKSSSLIGLLALASFCISTQAQLLARKDLTAALAITITQTAIATCKANGYNVSVTIVGRAGEIISQVRGDNTGPHTVENSMRKAYTSRTFRSPSGDTETRLKNDPAFALIHLSNVIANRGGLPIKVGDDTIAGVGISGAPGGDKDEACAKAGIDKVLDQLI